MPSFLSKNSLTHAKRSHIDKKYESGRSSVPLKFFFRGQTMPDVTPSKKDKEVSTQPSSPIESESSHSSQHAKRVSFNGEVEIYEVESWREELSIAEKLGVWWSNSDYEDFKICEAIRKNREAVARDEFPVHQTRQPLTVAEFEAKVELEQKKHDMALAFKEYEKAQAAKPWFEVLKFWKSFY